MLHPRWDDRSGIRHSVNKTCKFSKNYWKKSLIDVVTKTSLSSTDIYHLAGIYFRKMMNPKVEQILRKEDNNNIVYNLCNALNWRYMVWTTCCVVELYLDLLVVWYSVDITPMTPAWWSSFVLKQRYTLVQITLNLRNIHHHNNNRTFVKPRTAHIAYVIVNTHGL